MIFTHDMPARESMSALDSWYAMSRQLYIVWLFGKGYHKGNTHRPLPDGKHRDMVHSVRYLRQKSLSIALLDVNIDVEIKRWKAP